MNYTKKQHYVPQFYLKYFCINEDKINVYLKKENKILKNQLIRNVACENDYFDISLDKPTSPLLEEVIKGIDFKNKKFEDYVHTNNMEKFFSELESVMGNIFSKFKEYILNEKNINTVIPFSQFFEIRKYIILYILIQYMRSPLYKNMYIKIYNAVNEICGNNGMKNFNNKKIDIGIHDNDDAKVHHIRQIGELDNYNAKMMCIGEMTCDVLVNKTEESFITSDSPICTLKKVDDSHYKYSIFKKGDCNMIIFPLSTEICLVFRTSPLLSNDWYIKSCSDVKKVKKINTLIYQSCQNQVYTYVDELNLLKNVELVFSKVTVNVKNKNICLQLL
ncbi:DUF4238 domain-containing protein [Clostridium sp. C1]|uniref:DUF4238 domain-containing protein n=1 Tax=Clostridium sp. C1 TaxID=1155388 RepID=UPI001BA91949|nr:DUF4238 domain-containing protein [Clostridium sp. C1]QUN13130.1 DUF4238 domain-containing protein [Clostridium sp. C1]